MATKKEVVKTSDEVLNSDVNSELEVKLKVMEEKLTALDEKVNDLIFKLSKKMTL